MEKTKKKWKTWQKVTLISSLSVVGIFVVLIIFSLLSSWISDRRNRPIVDKITFEEKRTAKYIYLDSVFNSDYLQNMLLENEYEDINKENVVTFMKEYPLYQNLTADNKTDIANHLNDLQVSLDNNGQTLISLTVADRENEYNNLVFEYHLDKLPQNIYTFDHANKSVTVDSSQLKSFKDIFKVIDDIWNIRNKYNNFLGSKFSNANALLKNSDYQHTDIAEDMEASSTYRNFLSWNFDYKIIFNYKNQETALDNSYLQKNLEVLNKAIKENINENSFSEYNYNADYLSYEEAANWMSKKPYPNHQLYPAIPENNSVKQIDNQALEKTYRDKFLNSILFRYANLSDNLTNFWSLYDHINNIFENLFHTFASFTSDSNQESVFQDIIANDFNKNVYIYNKKDTDDTLFTLIDLPNASYKEVPNEIVDPIEEDIHYQEDISYLQYMFSQYIFGTDLLVDFKPILLKENMDFNNLNKNLELHYAQNKDTIFVNNTDFDQFKVIKQNLISNVEQVFANKDKILTTINLKPKYQYYFKISGKEKINPYATSLAVNAVIEKKTNNNFAIYLDDYDTISQEDLTFTLKDDYKKTNFFDPKQTAADFKSSHLFESILPEVKIKSTKEDETNIMETIWTAINEKKPIFTSQEFILTQEFSATLGDEQNIYFLKNNYEENINKPSGFSFKPYPEIEYDSLEKTINIKIEFHLNTQFEQTSNNHWETYTKLIDYQFII